MAAPGVAWERDILPARLPEHDPALLAERCGSGEVMWVAEGGKDARRARVRFFFRGEGGLFLERRPDGETLEGLSQGAREVYDFLGAEGAALLADVVDGTDLRRPEAQAALVELVLAGLATNDTLAALRAVLGYDPPPAVRPRQRSSLEAQLAVQDGRDERAAPARQSGAPAGRPAPGAGGGRRRPPPGGAVGRQPGAGRAPSPAGRGAGRWCTAPACWGSPSRRGSGPCARPASCWPAGGW